MPARNNNNILFKCVIIAVLLCGCAHRLLVPAPRGGDLQMMIAKDSTAAGTVPGILLAFYNQGKADKTACVVSNVFTGEVVVTCEHRTNILRHVVVWQAMTTAPFIGSSKVHPWDSIRVKLQMNADYMTWSEYHGYIVAKLTGASTWPNNASTEHYKTCAAYTVYCRCSEYGLTSNELSYSIKP